MNQAKIVMNNQEPRDFASLAKETKQLALATCGRAEPSNDFHLLHLAENLRRSEMIVWATKRVIASEAIGVNWEHLLQEITESCLRPFHEESYYHLKRMQNLMQQQLDLRAKKKPSQIDNFGFKIFHRMRHFELTLEDKQNLVWAASFHDLCHMCYDPGYWNTPGPFTPEQRKQLDFHAKNFFFLGQMLNVYQQVTALSVTHHLPNKGYPDNGIISELQPFLNDPKFRYMLKWLVTTDVYGGSTDRRSYRDKIWDHLKVIKETLPQELGKVGMGFVPFIHALWQPNQIAVCPA